MMIFNRQSAHRSYSFGISLVVMSLLIFACSCSNKTEDTGSKPVPESFSFLDLEVNSVFNHELRGNLREQLGAEGIEKRTTIDLSVNYPDFLQEYFPKLYQLNKRLNYRPQERIEHNITKLTYRYSRNTGKPFDLITAQFSNYSQRPLLIQIIMKDKPADMIDTLITKYGQPEIIQWTGRSGTSYAWEKHSDIFIVSDNVTRIGKPVTSISIYFVRNIEPLIEIEEKQIRQTLEEKKRAGETAF
ncbi:MAG: hypothetical protein PHP23_06755 [Desulfobacterales bacterium]|nr:hypothetical protein [Desulfobacterales bacterium]MDD4073230.1 hypothetical protein [Desulfobacterales bacterium]MDD4393609.1 hypothetical protein [Desulfobacterales bacterium]